MKSKQIKRSIFAILMIAVLMVGTSVVGVGAATQKTYLNTMGYSSFNSTCYYNNCSPFEGNDQHGNECTNAYQFYIDSNYKHYSDSEQVEEAGYCSYNVNFNLNKQYNTFNFKLTAGNRLDTDTARLTIWGDGIKLYANGVTEKTNQVSVNFDVTNVSTLKFELSVGFTTYSAYDHHYIILNDAYFTSEGTTTEPTTKETEPNQDEPSSSPTNPVKPPVTPDTSKPAVTTPTDSDEDVTTATKADISTEETTSKINPTASPNATSKVSTKDTATKDSANKGVASIRNSNSDNGTIQTGAISIAVILFVLLASLATGGFVWYRRKIK